MTTASKQAKEDWMNKKWRPAMGWMYMSVCLFDFMFAPIMWSIIQAYFKGNVQSQWTPLTLQGAGLFHVAMGAVLGIAAYGRTQEKINGATMNGNYVSPSRNTTYKSANTTEYSGNDQLSDQLAYPPRTYTPPAYYNSNANKKAPVAEDPVL